MGCGANSSKMGKLSEKELGHLKKWGKGAVARRRFKKLVQQKAIAGKRKPTYKGEKLVGMKQFLMEDDDLQYQISTNAEGRGLWWNTQWVELKDKDKQDTGNKYRG